MRRRRHLRTIRPLLALGLAAAILLTACGGSGGSSGAGATTTRSGSAAAIGPLTFQEASGAAAAATVAPDQPATIEATGPDGTRYTLEVPAGAVAEETTIRVVPLTDVSGLPGDAPTVAARFEPDGAAFAQPLRLTVTPGRPIPRAQRFAFTADQDGGDVTPALVDFTSTTAPALYLTHFSIAGVAGVNDSAFDAAVGVHSADRAAGIGDQIRENLQQAGRGDIDPGAARDRMIDLLDQFDSDVAQPALDSLANGPRRCSAVKTITAQILEFTKLRSLFELPDSKLDPVATLQAAYKDCEREAIRQCKRARKTDALVRFWLDQARTVALLGLGGGNTDPATLDKRAKPICVPQRYQASGGGNGVTITGEVPDITRPFTLQGSGDGFSITLSYTPADDTGRSGSMTYEGSGGGVPLSGSSSYTVTGEDGSTLTLTQTGSGCAGPDCAQGTEVVTLTPIT